MINTYLGQKGYTISKNEISNERLNQIKKDLTIKPYTPGAPVQDAITFPAYRESAGKIYVPHYYGVEQFGPPKEYKISQGTDINVEFVGKLRENQEVVVKTYVDHVLRVGYGGGLLELPCAAGKTVDGLSIISILKKKTFIIVHTEFLMNQWIERIEQFLPKARVGKIQGQVIDIDNKDIVIGMLQSLSMKEYPASIFESFGLTIIDEVHHISSQVFSNSLFKLVTKYMLGLSATMNRKDGTTHVFKMFLGDVVYKGKRDEIREVTVRAIDYYVNDDGFNHEAMDARGNPAYSTMISKLCEYNRRSEFILTVLVDMLRENPAQQIMFLAHNKNVLKYLYDAIKHRNIATVGYYIGGMKEQALKETESKKVVIATYSMAAEALDIKTLTTLVMVTPKTDIEQSVGRILREKHSQPIVVDIIDSHSIFQNQWKKRRAFYMKENYKIIYTTNSLYLSAKSKEKEEESIWETICEPGNKKSKTLKTPKVDSKDEFLQGKCLIKLK